MLLYLCCIAEHNHDQYRRQYYPAKQPITETGEQWQIRQSLCDPDRKRIQDSSGKTDVCRHIDHTKSRNGIIPHPYSQRYDDNHERQCFFTHPEDGPEQAEQNNDQGDHHVIHPYLPEQAISLYPPGIMKKR